MHHYKCVALCKDISLQRGRFCARSVASCFSRYSEDWSSWTFSFQVVRARPGGRLQFFGGKFEDGSLWLIKLSQQPNLCIFTVLSPCSTRSSSAVALTRPPSSSLWRITYCFDQYASPSPSEISDVRDQFSQNLNPIRRMVAAMRPFAASTAASCVNFGDRGRRATMSSSWHRADCTATLVVLQRSLVATRPAKHASLYAPTVCYGFSISTGRPVIVW